MLEAVIGDLAAVAQIQMLKRRELGEVLNTIAGELCAIAHIQMLEGRELGEVDKTVVGHVAQRQDQFFDKCQL